MTVSNIFQSALFSIAVVLISSLVGIGAGLFASACVFNFSSSDLVGTDAFESYLNIITFIVGTLFAAFMSGFLVSHYSKNKVLFMPGYGLIGVLILLSFIYIFLN